MRKIYAFLLPSFLFFSCGTQVNYLGTQYSPTQDVDVYVSESAVKKPFDVIGKGYVQPRALSSNSVEVIQRKAVEKAKVNGAHAVVIEDYYVLNNTATITSKRDSTISRSIQSANVNPTVASGFNILFIRYKD